MRPQLGEVYLFFPVSLPALGRILSGRLARLACRGTNIFHDEKNFVPLENVPSFFTILSVTVKMGLL